MTDDLIARLRCYPANRLCRQVADALEAKARRIAELEEQLRLSNVDCFNGEACIAELEAALKPFADEASYYEGRGKHLDIGNMGQLTVADLRAARAAYLGEKNDNE